MVQQLPHNEAVVLDFQRHLKRQTRARVGREWRFGIGARPAFNWQRQESEPNADAVVFRSMLRISSSGDVPKSVLRPCCLGVDGQPHYDAWKASPTGVCLASAHMPKVVPSGKVATNDTTRAGVSCCQRYEGKRASLSSPFVLDATHTSRMTCSRPRSLTVTVLRCVNETTSQDWRACT